MLPPLDEVTISRLEGNGFATCIYDT